MVDPARHLEQRPRSIRCVRAIGPTKKVWICIDRSMDQRVDQRMYLDRCIDGWINGWIDRWIDGWIGGWIGGWIDRRIRLS